MKRLKTNAETGDGLQVHTGQSGMIIKALNYWLCAETGVKNEGKELKEEFKIVVSEPFESTQNDSSLTQEKRSKNQISLFLEENGGPGIQHIGLHTNNIFESVRLSKQDKNLIKYYETPQVYYESVSVLFIIIFK
jgi:4-hydroxyphenylpyruvate dioxygenase-like protein